MVKLLFYMVFMFPMVYMGGWWLACIYLMISFFLFFNSLWFIDYYSSLGYSIGGDSLSMCMIYLSLWIIFLMLIASYSSYNNFYSQALIMVIMFLLLLLILSFSTSNLLMYYIYFESSLIPTLFLIFGWGYQPERMKAGYYLLFYTLFASLPLLLSVFYLWLNSGTLYFFMIKTEWTVYLYFSLVTAFLVKLPMVFVHFWLPSAHVEAPIAGSMILAGVLLKLGGYGLMRIFYMMNEFSINYNFIFISLSLYGSCLVGVLCLCLVDFKSLIAYSSVAHMGLVLCGIMTMNCWGLWGSLVLMIGHGFCSSGLFCLANIAYERVHSRSLLINKGLISLFPSMSLFWFILSVDNMAAPPSLNLLGELMLINSIMGWHTFSLMFLGLSSFLSCCYSIYLYSYTQHGNLFSGMNPLMSNNCREFFLIAMHIIPLNIMIMKSDLIVMWI